MTNCVVSEPLPSTLAGSAPPPGWRTRVIVQTRSVPSTTLTANGSVAPVTLTPLLHETLAVKAAAGVPATATASMVCDVPGDGELVTDVGPVVPPLPTPAPVPAVAPSIWMFHRPG